MKRIIALVIVIISTTGTSIQADSYFSSLGLGIPNYFVSAPAVGMGGAGIGRYRPATVNMMNPAAIDLNMLTTITLNYRYEMIENIMQDESVITRQGNPTGFVFAVPFMDNLTSMFSLKSLVSSQYFIEFRTEEFDIGYQRSVDGSGGLSAGNIGLQWKPAKWISVAGLADFIFGTYSEVWETTFDEDTFVNTTDDISSHAYGARFELGVLFFPYEYLQAGLVYKSSSSLSVDNKIVQGNGVPIQKKDVTINYPQSLGIGLAVPLEHFSVALDYYTQLWSEYSIQGTNNKPLDDYHRIGGGLEYLLTREHLESYYKRISYRVGAYYAELPFSINRGQPVKETFVTFGLGFPFHGNLGRIDISLEIGQRSDDVTDGYRENIIRVSGSVTSSERWFRRLF